MSKSQKIEDRKKGVNLIKDGCALIDTSSRTKIVKEKSVLALVSKDFNFTIMIHSKEKKKILRRLLKHNNENRSYHIMHSVKIYYAIKDYIDICPAFYICCEGFNKGLLKHYLKKIFNNKYHENKINILMSLKPLFGRKNIADRTAWDVNKKGKKPTMILKEKHFEKLHLL
ncbi:hypothetical protein CMI42_00300 [Candidatus Pacearchaeota archaeon]|nr:hypothetical protein [Candidatus Pacearchaeota archaeon]